MERRLRFDCRGVMYATMARRRRLLVALWMVMAAPAAALLKHDPRRVPSCSSRLRIVQVAPLHGLRDRLLPWRRRDDASKLQAPAPRTPPPPLSALVAASGSTAPLSDVVFEAMGRIGPALAADLHVFNGAVAMRVGFGERGGKWTIVRCVDRSDGESGDAVLSISKDDGSAAAECDARISYANEKVFSELMDDDYTAARWVVQIA